MESTSTKISAMIAMVISLISFGLVITALVISANETTVEYGHSKAFGFWMFGSIVSVVSMIFYFIDAILSAIKVFMKIHPVFNAILSVMLIAALPMSIIVGGSLGINIYIWNAYYLAIFILEVVSIIKHIKMKPSGDAV